MADSVAPKKRRLGTLSLRGLIVIVTLCALVVGFKTQRGRWYCYRMVHGDNPAYYFSKLMAYNGVHSGKPVTAGIDVWPAGDVIWVRHGGLLRCVKEDGDILGNTAWQVYGNRVNALWSGRLRNGCPCIVLFNNHTSEDAFVGLFVVDARFTSTWVSLREDGVSGTWIKNDPWPIVRLKTADGTFEEEVVLHPILSGTSWGAGRTLGEMQRAINTRRMEAESE